MLHARAFHKCRVNLIPLERIQGIHVYVVHVHVRGYRVDIVARREKSSSWVSETCLSVPLCNRLDSAGDGGARSHSNVVLLPSASKMSSSSSVPDPSFDVDRSVQGLGSPRCGPLGASDSRFKLEGLQAPGTVMREVGDSAVAHRHGRSYAWSCLFCVVCPAISPPSS